MIDKNEFKNGMVKLCNAFDYKFNQDSVPVYWEYISKQIKNKEEFKKVTDYIIMNNRFFPRISDFTIAVGKTIKPVF
ncbi:MAG: hypothetical protein DRI46_09390 [Chloroflexi bacterium]|nr:MAG: hypothetical protein DRI46_09390 [Chloroflexota bacterium]